MPKTAKGWSISDCFTLEPSAKFGSVTFAGNGHKRHKKHKKSRTLKACKALTPEHVAQVPRYLRTSGKRDAMRINFGSSRLEIKKFVL